LLLLALLFISQVLEHLKNPSWVCADGTLNPTNPVSWKQGQNRKGFWGALSEMSQELADGKAGGDRLSPSWWFVGEELRTTLIHN